MSHAAITAFVTVIGMGYLAPVPASAQNQAQRDADGAPTWTLPRTSDGRPDLQGYWTTQTFTPVERPDHLAGKEFFTEEETAALERQLTAEGVDPSAREILYIEDREEIERYKYQANRTPDYVVVFSELAANPPRIIPLDGRPHISDKIRQFPGDSRGRWEGDTLVVETRNFAERRRYRGSSGNLDVVERFTRVAADRIHYEFTVTDPTTWMSPWSAEVPMVKTEGPMFEYACHEGNHDIRHILEINRNLDKQAAADGSRQNSK